MSDAKARRVRSDGFGITKVGLWFALFAGIVLVAASNTGNNGLYLVLAVMLGSLVISFVIASLNIRNLELDVTAPDEIFANRPAKLELSVRNRSAFLPRWLLAVSVRPGDLDPPPRRRQRRAPIWLIPHLKTRQRRLGEVELLLRRRGRRHVRQARITSLFPLGFFRKGRRHEQDLELLVFPEIFTLAFDHEHQTGKTGEAPTRRIGTGQELIGLRSFRTGDDPRGIHWKQSARIGQMIYKEHSTEESRRMSIVFDNAVGEDPDDGVRSRFERLVSEVATVALDYLQRGFEVELITREEQLAFRAGTAQRRAILELLALIEPCKSDPRPLQASTPSAPHLRLAMEVA